MFGKPIAKTSGALFVAVGGASAPVATALVSKVYQFASNTACWIKQGFGAQTAAAAADNIFVPAGIPFYIHGGNGTHLSVIQDAGAGKCSLHEIQEV